MPSFAGLTLPRGFRPSNFHEFNSPSLKGKSPSMRGMTSPQFGLNSVKITPPCSNHGSRQHSFRRGGPNASHSPLPTLLSSMSVNRTKQSPMSGPGPATMQRKRLTQDLFRERSPSPDSSREKSRSASPAPAASAESHSTSDKRLKSPEPPVVQKSHREIVSPRPVKQKPPRVPAKPGDTSVEIICATAIVENVHVSENEPNDYLPPDTLVDTSRNISDSSEKPASCHDSNAADAENAASQHAKPLPKTPQMSSKTPDQPIELLDDAASSGSSSDDDDSGSPSKAVRTSPVHSASSEDARKKFSPKPPPIAAPRVSFSSRPLQTTPRTQSSLVDDVLDLPARSPAPGKEMLCHMSIWLCRTVWL